MAQAVPDGALVPLPRRRVSVLFDRIAEDFEGDQIFWRLLGDLLPGLRADDAIRVP
ncbi:MAG: hypothetical protein LBE85_11070 [Candidatus Accumulibacter sp.]|nr:hypothetical protein [Accumulibacter sp.]